MFNRGRRYTQMWQLSGPAGIGTPVVLDSDDFFTGTATATSAATTAAAPAGSLVVIGFANYPLATFTSVVDSAGNSYALAVTGTPEIGFIESQIWWCVTTNNLPIGSTFTFNSSANNLSGGIGIIGAISVTNASSGLDTTASGGSSVTAPITLTSGTLAVPNEILVSALVYHNSNTYTEDSNFTNVLGGTNTLNAAMGYRIVSSTASVTWNPSLSNPATEFSDAMASFKH
jgi:hypothetical protein